MHFDPVARVSGVSSGVKNIIFQKKLLINLYLFGSIFPGRIWITGLLSCIKVLKEFVSLIMVALGNRHYFSYHSNSSKEEKIF